MIETSNSCSLKPKSGRAVYFAGARFNMFRFTHILQAALLASLLLAAQQVWATTALPDESKGISDCVPSTEPSRPSAATVSGVFVPDPEIDRSPIWAVIYGRYIYLLGREMFWPEIERQDRFRIAIVNWPDLAQDLGEQLRGRAIAGLQVDIIALDTKALASDKRDFTMLFVGGSNTADAMPSLKNSLAKWLKKGNKNALIVTDGGAVPGSDVAFRRTKQGETLSLCVEPDEAALASKPLDLPLHFMQRRCP